MDALERAIIVGDTMVRRGEAADNLTKQLMVESESKERLDPHGCADDGCADDGCSVLTMAVLTMAVL